MTPPTRSEAERIALTDFERLRFFRDFTDAQRIEAFRASGLDECVLREVRSHGDQRHVLRWLERDGNTLAVRTRTASNSFPATRTRPAMPTNPQGTEQKAVELKVYTLKIRREENYSGEHRDWIEEYTLPDALVRQIQNDALTARPPLYPRVGACRSGARSDRNDVW